MPETNGVADAIEDAASEKLGVDAYDRPGIFRDAADAATDNSLPYWSVLVLSGAIATLGLALDNSAVVIGAMLVAPLLAPVIGLAVALAVGDGRLAAQTGAVVLASTAAVVGTGALLTLALPFQTVTGEILARTRPTTLDLAIAVLSGLVGAVVTVGRGTRLSAAIPGVAIAVALIPPLGVAGFGIGTGDTELIYGSLLLYGANLAGIVLSGMSVFLLVGMHGTEVVQAARDWHSDSTSAGVAARVGRFRLVRTLGVLESPAARIGLVLAFVIVLGLPLRAGLAEVVRETRVERAIAETESEIFDDPGRSSVLGKQVDVGGGSTQVYLRVATSAWFEDAVIQDFERTAATRAGEPITLVLEQLPARGNGDESLSDLFGLPAPPAPVQTRTSVNLSDALQAAQSRLRSVTSDIVVPEGTSLVGATITVGSSDAPMVQIRYTSTDTLAASTAEVIGMQIVRALGIPGASASVELVELIAPEAPDSVADGPTPEPTDPAQN